MSILAGFSTFVCGMILSFVVGATMNSGEMAIVTAVCYVGAILVGVRCTETKKTE